MFNRRVVGGPVVALILGLALGGHVLAGEGTKYGEGVTLTTTTAIADILAAPEAYLGKTVRVDGTVSAVCEEMGCWIELSDPRTNKGLRFKVEDGVIVLAALRLWGWLAQHPRLFALAMRIDARLLKAAANEHGMIRSLPFASGWTDRRDLPAPEGRTFRELYRVRSKA